MTRPLLLILPCNGCVRLGDYSLCSNWRLIIRDNRDLINAGILRLAAIDSCKPGIVPWGEEHRLRHCDLHPSYTLYYNREPWRLEILVDSVIRDIKELATKHDWIIHYINVKAYKHALREAKRKIGTPPIIDAGPPHPTPLSYRSRRNRGRLRRILIRLAVKSNLLRNNLTPPTTF